jgi:hypothetical protein
LAQGLPLPGAAPRFRGAFSKDKLMTETHTETNYGPLNLTLEEVRERIEYLVMAGNECHYHIGQLYNYVVTENLAEKGGYESAQHYFSQHIKSLSQATLTSLGTVARMFSQEACTNHGMSHLRLLLTYKATKLRKKVTKLEPMLKEDPGPLPIEVPRQDGTVQSKPFSECTVAELRMAVKRQRELVEKPVLELPHPEAARLQRLRERLDQHFSEGPVRLESRIHQGQTLLTLVDVPLARFERLLEELPPVGPALAAV